ncbi:MAG: class I mannose-6-phosphate isomerase [Chloroflexota bacterium]
MSLNSPWRKTTQRLAPAKHSPTQPGYYDLYPGFPIGPNKIDLGYANLARQLQGHATIIIDGYGGVLWGDFSEALNAALHDQGIQAKWTNINQALKPEPEIEKLVEPFLGGDDPIFGTRFTGSLSDFFVDDLLVSLTPDADFQVNILYGCGAALAGWSGLLIYVDVPKNEIQFRSRAESISNLGALNPQLPKKMYKRFYFVDWVALNQHKANLLPSIDIIVDEQRPDEPAFMTGDDLRAGLTAMSQNYFRVRPWFEPGAWGGQWIKKQIPQLPQEAVNYAWSFELIVPENGLPFESDGHLLEVSFDFLMAYDHTAILGDSADRFGTEFPIRFDFLDTFDGGNLSLQVHPQLDFIQQHFGETITQDETYYMLDCAPDAQVYLGFRDDINPQAFRAALEQSQRDGTEIDVSRYVNIETAHKHELFLIPNGTIHCSGVNCMVLEISATPYIFTFKMYDWMRLDLDGKPRPLNIDRAFQNLVFERKGEAAKALVSKPYILADGDDWRCIHLPTHSDHFYDVHRLEFQTTIDVNTNGSCHIMSLVEGQSLLLETDKGMRQRFNYAETFVVPTAAGSYRLINEGKSPAKVIRAFVKG